MKIEKIRIKNFKVYQDTEIRDLPNMCVFLGANGAGKSTLFEVFGFLSDALKSNVKTALNKRGGYKEVYSRNGVGDIEIEIKFRNPDVDGKKQPLITYELSVCLGETNMPVVSKEVLSYRRGNRGRPYRFLEFTYGKGNAIVNESEFETAKQEFKEQREEQTLDSPDILAIKGLGQFQKFNAISSFRRLLENWYVSNFQIQAAQNIEDTGLSEHLSTSGDNLAQVTKYIYENYPDTFQKILDKMKERVPGIDKVEATETIDGRIVLQFSDGSFKDPFISRFVSDGTIKMFAYLVLLNDPKPHPLLCIEEPENYLHPELLVELAEEFRDYANRGGQVFISSHSPDFVNALELDELFWLNKDKGFTSIKRASDDDAISSLFNDGDKLGYLWKQGYFIGSGPKN
ncbi:AAA family ATPase [Flavobacterium sp. M31R6]|uniref:AAA family ATPase n=1 Tax=Flavobacterium sp. M31R6 TaxID=2739062 RepID=UPI001568005B|nr:AAA family ATPase [Flavobacterium sp. M31R6]QKJ61972.1 AAA family ATPase [Flavobacterium sp. M31R6]